jgi:hypothetical protein
MPAVIQIYQAFARNFKLGKQAEDVLEQLGEIAQQAAAQPKQNPEIELEKQKMAMEQENEKAKMALEQAKAQQDAQLEAQKMQHEMQLEEMKLQHQMQLETMKMESQITLDRERAAQDAQLQREKVTADIEQKDRANEAEMQFKDRANKRELAAKGLQERTGPDGKEPDILTAVEAASSRSDELAKQLTAAIGVLAKMHGAPRRLVRDAQGRPSHSEIMGGDADVLSLADGHGAQRSNDVKELTEAIKALVQIQNAPRRVVRGPDGRASHTEIIKN